MGRDSACVHREFAEENLVGRRGIDKKLETLQRVSMQTATGRNRSRSRRLGPLTIVGWAARGLVLSEWM